MPTPHKHRDLIIAWANGELVEYLSFTGEWTKVDLPSWFEDVKYRLRSKEKVKKYRFVFKHKGESLPWVTSDYYKNVEDLLFKTKQQKKDFDWVERINASMIEVKE